MLFGSGNSNLQFYLTKHVVTAFHDHIFSPIYCASMFTNYFCPTANESLRMHCDPYSCHFRLTAESPCVSLRLSDYLGPPTSKSSSVTIPFPEVLQSRGTSCNHNSYKMCQSININHGTDTATLGQRWLHQLPTYQEPEGIDVFSSLDPRLQVHPVQRIRRRTKGPELLSSMPSRHSLTSCVASAASGCEPPCLGSDPGFKLSLKVSSANVCTLYEDGSSYSESYSTRRLMIMEQFKKAKFDFIGVQESRSPSTRVVTVNSYIVVSSAASQQRNYGCEIWINLSLKIQGQHPSHDCITLIHADPRILLISLQIGTFICYLLDFHAPQNESMSTANKSIKMSSKERSKWWGNLKSKCSRLDREVPLIVFCDANASMGSFESPHMSTYDA